MAKKKKSAKYAADNTTALPQGGPIPNIITPASPTQQLTSRSDLNISGWYHQWFETLPSPTDEVDEGIDSHVKERMMLDSIISSNIHYQVSAALDRPLEILPIIQDKTNPDYAKAIKAYDIVSYGLENYGEYLPADLRAMGVSTFVNGHSIAETVPEVIDTKVGQIMGLEYLGIRDDNSTRFVVDPHGRVKGIAGRIPPRFKEGQLIDQPLDIVPNNQVQGLPNNWRVFDRDRFAIMSHRGKNNDPRGESVLRAIYNEYYLLQAIFPHYLKYLLKFASPSLKGTVSEEMARPVRGGGKDPVDRLYDDMGRFENSSRIALAPGCDLELLFSEGDGAAFLSAFTLLEQRIIRGITNQMLSNTAARNNIRAAAATHQDIQNVLVREVRRNFALMLRRDVMRWLVILNLGQEWTKWTPTTNLAAVAPEDQATMLQSVAAAWRAGYIHPSQLRGTDAMVGLPFRESPDPGFYPGGVTDEPADQEAQQQLAEEAAKNQQDNSQDDQGDEKTPAKPAPKKPAPAKKKP